MPKNSTIEANKLNQNKMNTSGIVEIEILLTLTVIILALLRPYFKSLMVKYVDNHGYSFPEKLIQRN